ncbi:hypothetical protein ABTM34_20370, partial [Acinetobacter baumannii]
QCAGAWPNWHSNAPKRRQYGLSVEPKLPPDSRGGAAVSVEFRGGRNVCLAHPTDGFDATSG